MAAPKKKCDSYCGDKKNQIIINKKDKNRENIYDDDKNLEISKNKVIHVDFEGRNLIDSDFHGIKQLLRQLFLKAHINLSELTNLIISQNYVGSVIKQSFRDEEDDSDEEDFDANEVFGVTTVINLSEKRNIECIQQLRNLLFEQATEHGTKEVLSLLKNLLSNESKSVGLIINERFVNIPAQIAVPMLTSLESEIKKAVEKKMAFEFSHYILISKLYKANDKIKNKNLKKSNKTLDEIVWSNPEEEIIDQEADASFEFSVENESDSGLSGYWEETDEEMTPFRRVFLITASKLNGIIAKIEQVIA